MSKTFNSMLIATLLFGTSAMGQSTSTKITCPAPKQIQERVNTITVDGHVFDNSKQLAEPTFKWALFTATKEKTTLSCTYSVSNANSSYELQIPQNTYSSCAFPNPQSMKSEGGQVTSECAEEDVNNCVLTCYPNSEASKKPTTKK
ncbi:hypothetical protein QPK87_33285 [Kamptonema cortianum]|nr:hypothetical protein [Geitlerinema splendidum]MDK3161392.1 hypothetical protein [Kamptonema cortianum]